MLGSIWTFCYSPCEFLISNIGFREDATHTKDKTIIKFAVYNPLDKTLAPTAIFPDRLNDERILQMSLSQIPSPTIIAQKIKNRLNAPLSLFKLR